MFKQTYNGFQIKFPNGIVLSTIFSWGNYCSNYNNDELEKRILSPMRHDSIFKSEDAEVAVWDETREKDGAWLTDEMNKEVFGEELGDSVKGYVGFEDWLKIFDWCRNKKKGGD